MEENQAKRGPSDGSEFDVSDNSAREAEINTEDASFEKELEEMDKKRKEQDEERKRELKRMYDDAQKNKKEQEKNKKEDGSQKMIAGQPIQAKRVFEHDKQEGIFRHDKLSSFSTAGIPKIYKALKKVHGVSFEQKKAFVEALQAYNPTESILLKKDLEDFSRGLKSERYIGTKFNRMRKSMDPETLDFERREIDKIKRGLTGAEDPHKYKTKSSNRPGTAPRR